MDESEMVEFEKEMKGEGLDEECRDIIRGVYIGQNIRNDVGGILESYGQKFNPEHIRSLLKYDYIKEFQWYRHRLYCTTEKGSKIGKSEVTNLIAENKKLIEYFLAKQPQKVLNFVVQEHLLKDGRYPNYIYPVDANDRNVFHWKDRLRKNVQIHDVWISVLREFEALGLCIRTHSYVATRRGKIREEEEYVISPEVFTFLVECCRQEALSLTDKDSEKAELYTVLSQYKDREEVLWDKLTDTKLELEEEKVKEVVDEMAKEGITSEYKGFKNSEAPFSIKDQYRYEEWLEKNLWEPVVESLLEHSKIEHSSALGRKPDENNDDMVKREKIEESVEDTKIASDRIRESIFIGSERESEQWGIIGRLSKKNVLIDLNKPHTISIFGIQGSGKSYTLGVVTEMAVKGVLNISTLDKPLASVIFHYSRRETYTPEFESFTRPNKNQEDINELQALYKAEPMAIKNIKILVPPAKLGIRKEQYEKRNDENMTVEPLLFRPQELGAPEWSLLLGAGGEQLYLKKIKNILVKLRTEGRLTVDQLKKEIHASELTKNQKGLSILRVGFVEKFLDENAKPFEEYLTPGTITLLDIRDDMLDEREASILLGMLLISMGKIKIDKLLVIDEAHKYFGKTLAKEIVELIREMRHTSTRILIASQDPPSVNAKVIELSDVVILHRMNSPEWLKHIQGKNIALKRLKPEDLSSLKSGEAYIWASKSTEPEITKQPMKIKIRPRITEHGGATKTAV